MSYHQLPVSAATAGVFASGARPIRLVLVNAGQNFFDDLCPELDSEFEIVATANTGVEALCLALDYKADVVLLGGWQPDHETASLRRMKDLPRPPKVLVIGDERCESFDSSVLAAGADACLPRAQFRSEWRTLIRCLALPS